MIADAEDYIIPIPYANERDRRIYEPGYFPTHYGSKLDEAQRLEQRQKFYRMEGGK